MANKATGVALRSAQSLVEARPEASIPEVLRGPHLGIMSELLTYLTCLAVAWGLRAAGPPGGATWRVLGWAKWPVCEIWVSMYVHLISQIHPKSSVSL